MAALIMLIFVVCELNIFFHFFGNMFSSISAMFDHFHCRGLLPLLLHLYLSIFYSFRKWDYFFNFYFRQFIIGEQQYNLLFSICEIPPSDYGDSLSFFSFACHLYPLLLQLKLAVSC